jgi:hypothetical protein
MKVNELPEFSAGFPLAAWPRRIFANCDLLLHETKDDEGAMQIFGCVDWQDVDAQELLKNPTAQWFLNEDAFIAMSPAILLTVSHATRAHQSKELQLGTILLDHFESNLKRRRLGLERSAQGVFNSLQELTSELRQRISGQEHPGCQLPIRATEQ